METAILRHELKVKTMFIKHLNEEKIRLTQEKNRLEKKLINAEIYANCTQIPSTASFHEASEKLDNILLNL